MALAFAPLAAASPMSAVTSGLFVYCVLTVVILLAYARTRIYPLYLLKIAWIALTIVGFVWIISMSLSDPGPQHGGEVSEFMKNPAGPFTVLGGYGDLSRRLYGSSPGWLLALPVLLLLWRGLIGAAADKAEGPKRLLPRVFLAVTAALACTALLWADRYREGFARYAAAAHVSAGVILWALLPLSAKRGRLPAALFWMLSAAAAAPVVVGLAQFDWMPYAYATTNYAFAWSTARMGQYMLNSLMVSVLAVGITSLLASMAAYALTRFDFVGRNWILFTFIGAMAIPIQLYIVPLFLMVQNWHVSIAGLDLSFMDSRLGLSLIYAAAGLPFAVFLLTGFYRTLPHSLREAAAIDGCSAWRTFSDVYFPLAGSGLATAAIFQFLTVWNEYEFALVFLTNDKLKTLPVGLYNLSVSQQFAANWPALFAGVTILCLPTFLIFLALQERIIAGLTVGAVKE